MKNDEVSKFFAGLFCAVLPNLNGPFLNIILGNSAFSRDFPVFPEIMETGGCAKCIKTGKAKPPKSRKNEKILYIYEFAPSKIPCFSGFSVNQVYKCEKVIHQRGPEKCRNLGLFFGSFGANGQNPAGCAGNANVRSNFCMNMQFPGRGAKKIFSKIHRE